jgi:predicted dehydrogenase
MNRTRIGIVSATGTGRKRLLPALRDSDTCQVTAIHGRDAAGIRQLADTFEVAHSYTDLSRMIAEGEFDLAVVCSPPFMHREQLQALLGAGIATLCEKPLALTESDALAIAQMAGSAGALVMVAHQLRHQNTYAEIKASLAKGEIGQVESAFMEWSFTMDPLAPSARWKRNPALNGPSALSDVGVHCFDLAIGLFGPGTVVGASSPGRAAHGVFEECKVRARHSSVDVAFQVSRLSGPDSNRLVIGGAKGEISAPMFFTEASAPVVRIAGETGERTIQRLSGSAYRQEVEDFAAAVRGHADPRLVSAGTTLDEAIAACRMLDQAHALLEAQERAHAAVHEGA